MKLSTYYLTETKIVGSNPEMADLDNPNGHRFAEAYFVFIEDENGRRSKRCVGLNLTQEEIDSWVQRLRELLNGGFDPRKFEAEVWEPTYPSYGSRAYVEDGAEEEWGRQEREIDERGF